MRLYGISSTATVNFCGSKKRKDIPEPKVRNPHNFKIETATDSYGGIEYYIHGYDKNARQAATFVEFHNESTKKRQQVLNRALSELYEQPLNTFSSRDEEPVDTLVDCCEEPVRTYNDWKTCLL